MPIETTENYIRVRVEDPELFIAESLRTVDISVDEGIKSIQGKLKSDGESGAMKMQAFLFDLVKWTEATAGAWVKDHGHTPKLMKIKNAVKKIGNAEHPAIKILPISNCKAVSTDSGIFIEGYANTKGQSDRYGDVPTVYKPKRDYVYDLKEYLKNPVLLIDHVNSIDHVAGSMSEIREDGKGLYFKAKFSESGYPVVDHARRIYTEGHAKGISIAGAFHYENQDEPNQLTLAEIYEISLVAVPADPDALAATIVKAGAAVSNDALDSQTKASLLHNAKSEIDRWLTDLQLKNAKSELDALAKRFLSQ
jgi:HK97 family phage prohead protease